MCLPFIIASYISYALKKQNGAISPIFKTQKVGAIKL
jgi:hypothetical protein